MKRSIWSKSTSALHCSSSHVFLLESKKRSYSKQWLVEGNSSAGSGLVLLVMKIWVLAELHSKLFIPSVIQIWWYFGHAVSVKVGEASLRDFACVHLSLVDGADILLIYFRRSTEVNSVMIFLSSSFLLATSPLLSVTKKRAPIDF